ncbi:MAG: hypothetical protein QXV32_07375 [Conexivisphaerales archaeon]
MKSKYVVGQGDRRQVQQYDDELTKAIRAKFDAAIALVRLLPDDAESE